MRCLFLLLLYRFHLVFIQSDHFFTYAKTVFLKHNYVERRNVGRLTTYKYRALFFFWISVLSSGIVINDKILRAYDVNVRNLIVFFHHVWKVISQFVHRIQLQQLIIDLSHLQARLTKFPKKKTETTTTMSTKNKTRPFVAVNKLSEKKMKTKEPPQAVTKKKSTTPTNKPIPCPDHV